MGMIKFCHVKKNDQVIVLTGDFKKKVGVECPSCRKKITKNKVHTLFI